MNGRAICHLTCRRCIGVAVPHDIHGIIAMLHRAGGGGVIPKIQRHVSSSAAC